jgi:hypothetical protein
VIIDNLLPLITKAVMVLIVSEFVNKWTPKWLKPTYILPVISIGIVYFYKSEFLIADSVVVMSLSVLMYEFFGKDIIAYFFNKLKADKV